MKTLNDYMAMPYRMEIVEDKDEGGFVVSSRMVSISEARTVRKMNLVFNWAVMVSSKRVGLWVAMTKKPPYCGLGPPL